MNFLTAATEAMQGQLTAKNASRRQVAEVAGWLPLLQAVTEAAAAAGVPQARPLVALPESCTHAGWEAACQVIITDLGRQTGEADTSYHQFTLMAAEAEARAAAALQAAAAATGDGDEGQAAACQAEASAADAEAQAARAKAEACARWRDAAAAAAAYGDAMVAVERPIAAAMSDVISRAGGIGQVALRKGYYGAGAVA